MTSVVELSSIQPVGIKKEHCKCPLWYPFTEDIYRLVVTQYCAKRYKTCPFQYTHQAIIAQFLAFTYLLKHSSPTDRELNACFFSVG